MAELDLTLERAALPSTSARGGLYDNSRFTEDQGTATVYVEVDSPPTSGRVHPFIVPAAELAVTVHPGPHDDIDISYGALGGYVADHALAIAGPVREVYLVGPRDTADSTAWRTEIGWSIFRTSAS